jgi:hypothetical protein
MLPSDTRAMKNPAAHSMLTCDPLFTELCQCRRGDWKVQIVAAQHANERIDGAGIAALVGALIISSHEPATSFILKR